MEQAQGKKIIFVITKSNWGGAQRYVYDLATALHVRGTSVLVAAGGDGELMARLQGVGVETISVGGLARDMHLGSELKAFKVLLSLFRTHKPDVVHLNSSKAGLAALAARLAGVPKIVFTVHGWGAWNEARPLLQKVLIAVVYWITLLLSHEVIMVSRETRKQGRFFPFVQKRITIIHNGVHPIPFLSREEARKKLLPHSNRSLWIGTIGELHPIKGHHLLIEAYEHFVPYFPDSELVIIGEGQERSALERQMRIEGVSDTTHLMGHLPDAAMYLQAFDIFVLPSRSEGLPYVLLEAAQAGLAVVATAVGGSLEIVTDETTGVLLPYGDRSLLTEALEYVAGDETLRQQLGTALKAYVEKEFGIEQMIEQTLSLY